MFIIKNCFEKKKIKLSDNKMDFLTGMNWEPVVKELDQEDVVCFLIHLSYSPLNNVYIKCRIYTTLENSFI